ncbi:MAG TPA: CHAD domain-containing protein [Steroidobacteraceae bacterium]|nr:CHAD domain-containing protein [Steroidobacteraceae bacterium]
MAASRDQAVSGIRFGTALILARSQSASHRTARKHRSTECMHEWRKRTKYLWHQVQLLAPPSSKEMHQYADGVHRLSDYLGDDHDLAVLRSSIFGSRKLLDKESEDALKAFIDRRRAKLQSKAFGSAVTLLKERPNVWCAQLKRRVKKGERVRKSDGTARRPRTQ